MRQKERSRRIALSYLKDKYKTILAYVFIVAVFFMVAFLYGYEQIYVDMLYAVLLALFFGGVFVAVDFLRYFRRCMALYQSLERREERQKSLPEASGLQEVLYQEMLEDMRQENCRLQTEYDRKKKDMADYYTMWTHQIKTPIAALRLLLQDDDADTGEDGQHSGGRCGCVCRRKRQEKARGTADVRRSGRSFSRSSSMRKWPFILPDWTACLRICFSGTVTCRRL